MDDILKLDLPQIKKELSSDEDDILKMDLSQIRKELPSDGDDMWKDKWKIYDAYRSQYAEKADLLKNMYPEEFIMRRHDDNHPSGRITVKTMEYDQAGIIPSKIRGVKSTHNETHPSTLFVIPTYGDIFNCIYIPEEVQSAELMVCGDIISTWRKSCHPSEKITYDDVVYYKVNFLSPAMFSTHITYGLRFIKLSTPCNYIMMENIFLDIRDYDHIIKPDMIIFPEYESRYALYRATDGHMAPIVYDYNDKCVKVKKQKDVEY